MRLTIALLFLLIAPPPTDTYTLSLHDALPISPLAQAQRQNAIREWSTCSTRTPPAMLGRPLRPSRTYGTRRRSHDDLADGLVPDDLPQQAKDRALLEHMDHVHRHAAARHTVARRDLLVQDDVADARRGDVGVW